MRSIDDSEVAGKREANADNGRRGLAKTRAQFFFQGVWRDRLEHHTPDYLLLDVSLVHENGLDLVDRMHEVGMFAIQVIVITGNADLADVVRLRRQGIEDVLSTDFEGIFNVMGDMNRKAFVHQATC